MKILNVINNNVVSSLDEKEREIIVMGRGIGFKKKSGEPIPNELITKVFRLPDETHSQFTKLVQGMSYTHMKLASDIIDYAEEHLGIKLRKSIYVTLTDHLDFAIRREKEGMVFQNALLWEVKKCYTKEFEVGLKAKELVLEREGITLSEHEIGFIALHIINAEEDSANTGSQVYLTVVREILSIIQNELEIELKENTIDYERFHTHLRFFIQRALNKEYKGDDLELAEVYADVIEKCTKEYSCAKKIKNYVREKLDFEASEEELAYLTIHLNRLTRA